MKEHIYSIINSLPGWTSIQKANTLYQIVKQSDAKVVVEIGTFAGRAAIALASGCKETGGKYYGIDPYHSDPCLEGSGNEENDKYWLTMDFSSIREQAIMALQETQLMDHVELIEKRSQDAVSIFKSERAHILIDVLYIDGNFTPEVTIEDVNNYAPLIKTNGFLILNNSDWGTKAKAKKQILELGFVEYLKEIDSDKTTWTVYQKSTTKSDIVVFHPVESVSMAQPGWGTLKQCMALYQLVLESKAKVSVDIGVFGGRFLSAMALAHKENGYGKCFGIDPWDSVSCTEGSNDKENDDWWTDPTKVDFKRLHKDVVELMIKEDLTDYSNILRFKSSEVWPLFTQIDILSIDGNHSEEVSCKDVEQYAPLVKPGGYIHWDDANWPTTQKAQQLILHYGFEEVMFIEEGEGRDWKIFRKLGGEELSKLDVATILNEAKKQPPKEDDGVSILNPTTNE